MNRYVIYTCLVGNYDTLKEPLYIDKEFDYICFTDNLSNKGSLGVWEYRKIENDINNPTRLSRFPKINPHLVLNKYFISVYIDSNLLICGKEFYNIIKKLDDSGVLMACVLHPDRECVYDEIKECVKLGRDNYMPIWRCYNFLRENGYPEKNGLFENNVIFRQHNNEVIKKISELWWDMYMQFSKRDQLTLGYVLWKINFKPDLFFPVGISTHNNDCIKRLKHNKIGYFKRVKLALKRFVWFSFCRIVLPIK